MKEGGQIMTPETDLSQRLAALETEIERLCVAKRRWSALAEERGKQVAELKLENECLRAALDVAREPAERTP